MNHLTPEQKVDEILDFIKKSDIVYKEDLISEMGKIYITRIEVGRAILKLNKDERIIENKSIREDNPFFVATFDGVLFHGYERQREVDELSFTIALQNENQIRSSQRLLLLGTWFAGIAALLLFLWQIFLYLYPHQSDWYFFWFQKIR